MWYLIMAFSAGIGIAMQAAINSQLGKALFGQPILAALWSFSSGTVFLFVLSLWFAKGSVLQGISLIPSQPWWLLLGGIIGSGLVFSSIFLAPKMGIANMLFFMIVGQVIFGLIIDQFGLFNLPIREISINKIIGLFVMLAGLFIFFFAKK